MARKKVSKKPARARAPASSLRFGYRPPKPGTLALRFGYYVHVLSSELKAAVGVPDEIDYTDKAMASIDQMLHNDVEGCCVISSLDHIDGMMTGEDTGTPRLSSDAEVKQKYHRICGAGDNGCYLKNVLDEAVRGNYSVAGQKFAVEGYALVSNKDLDLLQTAFYLNGPLKLGLFLQPEWVNAQKWTLNTKPNDPNYGHCVPIAKWSKKDGGVYVATWGGLRFMPFETLVSKRLSEVYTLLAADWWGNDQLSANGVAVDDLRRDLALFNQGKIPEIPSAALVDLGDLA